MSPKSPEIAEHSSCFIVPQGRTLKPKCRQIGGTIKTPLKKVANITPALVIELEAMGYHTLEDLQNVGWEKLCIGYSKTHSAALTSEFFTLLYAVVHNIPVRKVTKEQIKKADKLCKKIKAGFDPGFAKKSRKKKT